MANERAIATTQQAGALTQPGGFGLEGLEGLDSTDMIVPRWDILQPTSRKDGTPGWYCLNLGGETRESIEAVILRISRTRVLWSGNQADKTPECSSNDGITGREHGQCSTCEFSRYDVTGIRKSCKAGYTYLLAAPDNPEDLSIISMYGTSATPGKVLNSQFIRKRRSPFTAVVTFKTKAEVGEKGRYFVQAPVISRWLSPEEAAPFQEASRAMFGVQIREVEPVETAASAEGVDAPTADVAAEQDNDLWDRLGATQEPPAGQPAGQPVGQPTARRKAAAAAPLPPNMPIPF